MLSKYNLLFYSMGLLLFAMCMAPSNVLAKQLYWGDLHVHTSFSSDAYLFGNQRAGPVEAYAFAMKRQAITLADGRQVMIGRPLDFMAVTDHAEYFDLMNMCLVPATPQYGTPYCSQFRAVAGNAQSNPTAGFQAITSPSYFLRHGQFCINNPGICPVAADTTWQRIQTAANLANLQPDFTAFIAQEWSGQILVCCCRVRRTGSRCIAISSMRIEMFLRQLILFDIKNLLKCGLLFMRDARTLNSATDHHVMRSPFRTIPT